MDAFQGESSSIRTAGYRDGRFAGFGRAFYDGPSFPDGRGKENETIISKAILGRLEGCNVILYVATPER
jgi:hypothetical protein